MGKELLTIKFTRNKESGTTLWVQGSSLLINAMSNASSTLYIQAGNTNLDLEYPPSDTYGLFRTPQGYDGPRCGFLRNVDFVNGLSYTFSLPLPRSACEKYVELLQAGIRSLWKEFLKPFSLTIVATTDSATEVSR